MERHAWPAFAVLALAAVGFTLWLGQDAWFFHDECDFLARDFTLTAILAPHNEHWVSLPFLAYRAVLAIFGTGSYLPFLVLLALTHVAAAAGLMLLLRPAWYALAAAVLFLFLGAGFENQFWAFQVGFVGSVAFGVWALVAARSDRPLLTAVLLTCAAASSLTGLPFIVAAALLLRRGRGWLLLPVLTFAEWYVAFGAERVTLHRDPFTADTVIRLPGFVGTYLVAVPSRMLGWPELAGALVALALCAMGVVVVRNGWRPPRAAVAGVVGAVALFALIGVGRMDIGGVASRYMQPAAPFVLLALSPAKTGRFRAAIAGAVFLAALATNVTMMARGAQLMTFADGVRC